MYSATVLARRLAPLLALLLLAGCASRRPAPKAPLFPLTAAWKTLLGDFVVSPLAADARRLYVATRDGVVRALDPATGRWRGRQRGFPVA